MLSKTQEIVCDLRKRIADGELAVAEPMMRQVEIERKWHVSRNVSRGVMDCLIRSGLISPGGRGREHRPLVQRRFPLRWSPGQDWPGQIRTHSQGPEQDMAGMPVEVPDMLGCLHHQVEAERSVHYLHGMAVAVADRYWTTCDTTIEQWMPTPPTIMSSAMTPTASIARLLRCRIMVSSTLVYRPRTGPDHGPEVYRVAAAPDSIMITH